MPPPPTTTKLSLSAATKKQRNPRAAPVSYYEGDSSASSGSPLVDYQSDPDSEDDGDKLMGKDGEMEDDDDDNVGSDGTHFFYPYLFSLFPISPI
jgi:hypothetical protein